MALGSVSESFPGRESKLPWTDQSPIQTLNNEELEILEAWLALCPETFLGSMSEGYMAKQYKTKWTGIRGSVS